MCAEKPWLTEPVIRKIGGLNLPTEVEVLFAELIQSRLALVEDSQDGCFGIQASFPGGSPGEWYDAYGWVYYVFEDGRPWVNDVGVDFIPRHADE